MLQILAPTIGLDAGTCNTAVYVRRRGIVVSEPTLLVRDLSHRSSRPYAGDDAEVLLGRTGPTLQAIRPIRNGCISDFDMTGAFLRYIIHKAIGPSHLGKPKVIVSVPAGMSDVNRRAMVEAVKHNGGGKVYLVDKPMVAALGSNLPVYEPQGSMVVDIGGGTTDIAVVSLGGLVVSQSIPVGGVKMDEAIINHIKKEFNMLIGERTAEDVKKDLATAMPLSEERSVRIRGRDLLSPQAMEIEYTSAQAYTAVQEPCKAILAAIKWVLERTPPELAGDIMRTGIHLTGRVAQMYAMDQFISTKLGIPVMVDSEPGDCTAMGLGYLVENMTTLEAHGRLPQPV